MHLYYQRDLFIFVAITTLLAITCALFEKSLVGDGLTRDDLFYESGIVYRVDYMQTANVSTGVDERMITSVNNPCRNPYAMVCSKWTKSGSYLVDNARAIHDRRLQKALVHSSINHPFLSSLYQQCIMHLTDADTVARSFEFMQGVVQSCELPNDLPVAELDGNLARLRCYARHAIFPLLDWRDVHVQPSPWMTSDWPDVLIRDTCETLRVMPFGTGCDEGVHSSLNVLKHISSVVNEQKITPEQWITMTHGQLPLNTTENSYITVWNREMMLLLLNALSQPSFKWLIRAAAVGDMLQYTGGPAGKYFTMYSTVTSLNLANAERTHPPSVYGWGPTGYAQIMVPRDVEEEAEYHPDVMNVCLDGVGDLLPQVIDRMIYPKPEVLQKANEMIENIRSTYINVIQNSDVLKASFKETMIKLLSSMEIVIGNNRHVHIEQRGDTFLELALIARAFNRDNHEAQEMPGNFHFDTFNAMYNPTRNRIFIPTLLLLSPFFNASDADELHYGRLGMLVAHEMGHIFNRFQLQRDRRMSGEDFRIYSNALRCFENSYEAFNEKETLPDVMGFEMALRACQRQGSCLDPRKKMLFFAVYGQTMCENRDNGFGVHNAPWDRVYINSMLARNEDGTGFASSVWSCSKPSSCAFWK